MTTPNGIQTAAEDQWPGIDALEAEVSGGEELPAGEPAPEPEEPAAPTEAPTEPEAPAEPAQQPSQEEVTRLREENQRLQRESQQRQEEAEQARIERAAAEYAQRQIRQYTSQGYDEQTARALGVADARAQVAEYRAQQATLRSTAQELSHQFGVPQEQLRGFRDEASMRQFAEQYSQVVGPQAKELAELRKEIAELKKGQVPAQPYNQPGGTGSGGSDEEINRRYARGDIPMTDRVRQARKRLFGTDG